MREFEIISEAGPSPVEGGERVTVTARIPEDLRYVEGHFENDPIVPGVAQLLPLVHDPIRRHWPELGAPTGIRRLKFLQALRPGESIEVRLTRSEAKVRFEIHRGATRCTRGALVFG